MAMYLAALLLERCTLLSLGMGVCNERNEAGRMAHYCRRLLRCKSNRMGYLFCLEAGMTPERAAELAKKIAKQWKLGNMVEFHIRDEILAACKEEKADVLKGEFICARCGLRKDSDYEMKYDF